MGSVAVFWRFLAPKPFWVSVNRINASSHHMTSRSLKGGYKKVARKIMLFNQKYS